jgi:hypothetical protein
MKYKLIQIDPKFSNNRVNGRADKIKKFLIKKQASLYFFSFTIV